MVVSKDDSFSAEPRPQMVRSKSVGAITRRTHGPLDYRKHKKKPYSLTGNIGKRQDCSSLLVSPSVTNCKNFPTHQEVSDLNCDSTDNSLKIFPSIWGLENTSSVSTERYASSCPSLTPNNLERRLSVESKSFKGSNLPKDIDYFSNSLISLSAKSQNQPLYLASGIMTEDRPPIFAGQLPGQLKDRHPQLINNKTYVNSQEEICKLQAYSSSTGLAQMENFQTECMDSENNDSSCQHKLDESPSMHAHQYNNHGNARHTRRPLGACNLQDNQLNIQRCVPRDSTADPLNVGQLHTRKHKECIPGQMFISGAKVSPTFSCDENVTDQVELTRFALSQDDGNVSDADQAIHSPIFIDECLYCTHQKCLDCTQQKCLDCTHQKRLDCTHQKCLDCTHQNTDQKNILTDDKACKLTDELNVLRCNHESNHQLSHSLRRQDTLLIQQDKIDDDDDDDDADNGDFDSFFDSLKKFLCQEVPDDDDILQEANTREEESSEAEMSYKNLLNCPPRFQCALCDSNLEVVPFRQYPGDCENEYFPGFILEDSRSQTELYCPQCSCHRSIY